MRAVVDLGYLADRQLRVSLRSREPFMSEQLLNGPQIGPFFQHVRAKGVAQRVRMNIGGQSMRERDVLDDAADAAGGEPAIAAQPQIE
jgi:hypothetical protein